MAGARSLLRQRVQSYLQENLERGTFPGETIDGSQIMDVDINPSMSRFGDAPQSWWERNVKIGFFEIKIDRISVHYERGPGDTMRYSWSARFFIAEQSGVAAGEKFGWLAPVAGKRYMDYGGSNANGNGSAILWSKK